MEWLWHRGWGRQAQGPRGLSGERCCPLSPAPCPELPGAGDGAEGLPYPGVPRGAPGEPVRGQGCVPDLVTVGLERRLEQKTRGLVGEAEGPWRSVCALGGSRPG